MPLRFVVTRFLLLCSFLLAAGDAFATDGAQCVSTQCEGPGQACVSALYGAYDACMAAGNKKCSAALPAEKFKCLTNELKPSASERNAQQTACLDSFRSCYAACAPMEGTRADFWCVGDDGTAVFCEADPADPANMDACESKLIEKGAQGGMTCESV